MWNVNLTQVQTQNSIFIQSHKYIWLSFLTFYLTFTWLYTVPLCLCVSVQSVSSRIYQEFLSWVWKCVLICSHVRIFCLFVVYLGWVCVCTWWAVISWLLVEGLVVEVVPVSIGTLWLWRSQCQRCTRVKAHEEFILSPGMYMCQDMYICCVCCVCVSL